MIHGAGEFDAVLDCEGFLEGHSDFLDGLLPARDAARFLAHLELCAPCGRYDRIVRRGQALVRNLPQVMPSDDFEQRLQHRLFHIDDEETLNAPARRLTGTAALAIAAALAIVAWSPLLVRDDGAPTSSAFTASPLSAPSAVTSASLPVSAVNDPLFRQQQTWYPAPVSAPAPTHSLAAFPGPYSPLIVTPPVHRAVRTVSTEYVPTY